MLPLLEDHTTEHLPQVSVRLEVERTFPLELFAFDDPGGLLLESLGIRCDVDASIAEDRSNAGRKFSSER